VRSSEAHCHQGPGDRTEVVEALSSRGLAPPAHVLLSGAESSRKFRPEIRSTVRVKSQILNSAEKCRVVPLRAQGARAVVLEMLSSRGLVPLYTHR
jgi:hypothetical protein